MECTFVARCYSVGSSLERLEAEAHLQMTAILSVFFAYLLVNAVVQILINYEIVGVNEVQDSYNLDQYGLNTPRQMKKKLTVECDKDEEVDRIRYVEKHDSDCYKDRWLSLDRDPSHYYQLSASFREVLDTG